jgi:mannose-1-phosphate guanylyltransferase
VAVIAKAHYQVALGQLAGRELGELVVQPENLDTAAGIFLALTHVCLGDPGATVVIYPSDHFVYPESQFVRAVESAVRATNLCPDRLVLVTVSPDRVEPEYGWIRPGLRLGCIREHSLHEVEMFVEKPNAEVAREIMLGRALWNTLILVARVEALWKLGWQLLPDMMRLFERYGAWIGTRGEEAVREAVYRRMPRRNFSSHLLACAHGRLAAIEMNDVIWSDWGKAERIVSTLRQIGKYPAFSADLPEPIGRPATSDDHRSLAATS